MNCREYFYDTIGAIEVIPDSKIQFSKPFQLDKKSASPSFLVSGDSKKSIPMKKKSGTLKEAHSISVAGESYEITIKWEIEKVTEETYTILEGLKNGINHLIIRTFSDEGYFVRSVFPGYSFKYYENEGVINCEMVVVNTTGLQRFFN